MAYTLDMARRTDGFYGVNESLFSSALAAMVFSIMGAQPLTIVGITGLISLFNYTIYDIIKLYDVSIYPQFMAWTAIWAAIWHWLAAIWNLCDYMRYVTDFSSETFGMYVGIIYMSECCCCVFLISRPMLIVIKSKESRSSSACLIPTEVWMVISAASLPFYILGLSTPLRNLAVERWQRHGLEDFLPTTHTL